MKFGIRFYRSIWLACAASLLAGCQPAAEKSLVKSEDNAGFYKSAKEFKDALARLKIKRDGIQQTVDHLDNRKAEIVKRLKELGVESSADYKKSEETQLNAKLLQSLIAQTSRLKSDIERYDQAIIRVEAKLKDIEIAELTKGAGLSDQQFIELSRTIHDLDEQMGLEGGNLLDELELQEVLDKELGVSGKEGKGQDALQSPESKTSGR